MYILLLLAVLWEIYWKYFALWAAANRGDKTWFLAILIFNTIGILPIYYLYKNGHFISE
tara:strand:- start:92 stop:268 length:177 start_codon:yes stop_codon:yes gene_type:complete